MYKNQKMGVLVLTFKQYISEFWAGHSIITELYSSLSEAAATCKEGYCLNVLWKHVVVMAVLLVFFGYVHIITDSGGNENEQLLGISSSSSNVL